MKTKSVCKIFTGILRPSFHVLLFGFLGFLTGDVQAVTYTSIANGNWTNATNVWSTNGSTACGCAPATSLSQNVVINHAIGMNADISIVSGGEINVSANASLSSTIRKLTISNGILEAYGSVSVKEITINISGAGFFYGPVTVDSKFFVEGELLFDSLMTMTNASLELKPGSYTTAGDGWEINIPNGNIYNQGTINFSGTCLIMNNGSFYNQVGGIITGYGYIETENGNFYNSGSWVTDVNWCSSGTGNGMPEPEDCGSGSCGNVNALPVTLISFTAEAQNDMTVVVNWITTSEMNNDYFTIERSQNGSDFIVLDKIDGAGNSSTTRQYYAVDAHPETGENYYRLSQTDFDGTKVFFETSYVKLIDDASVTVYPLPVAGNKFNIYFSDASSPERAELLSPDGRRIPIVLERKSEQNIFEARIPGDYSFKGIYVLSIVSGKTVLSRKVLFAY